MRDGNNLRQKITSTPFFKGLPDAAVIRATSHMVTRTHPSDQVILLENDWGNSVYFILDGWVKIRTYNLDGKEITLNILGFGEMFGEMAPLDQVPRSTDVITLTPTTIGSLPASDFVHLIETEPVAGIHLARLMAKRLRQVNRRLRLREADSTSRVADVLLFLAEGQGTKGTSGVEIHKRLKRKKKKKKEEKNKKKKSKFFTDPFSFLFPSPALLSSSPPSSPSSSPCEVVVCCLLRTCEFIVIVYSSVLGTSRKKHRV